MIGADRCLFYSFGILFRHEFETNLHGLFHVECIHEANTAERLIFADLFKILMLNIHRGDVIRQQHYFVAVEFVPVFMFERGLFDRVDDVNYEIAGADKRVEYVDVFVGERFAEFFLQDLFDRSDHEIDYRLRCVNNAVRVGDIDGKALEKPLVNVVKKRLLFGKRLDGVGQILLAIRLIK